MESSHDETGTVPTSMTSDGYVTSSQSQTSAVYSPSKFDRQPQQRQQPLDNNLPIAGGIELLSRPSLHASSSFESTIPSPQNEAPDFRTFRMLIGSLMLTTLLAVGSALDARNQCVETDSEFWVEMFDDDAMDLESVNFQDGRKECLNMFHFVILPVGGGTILFCLAALCVINRHLSHVETTSEAFIPSHLSALLQLMFLLLIALGLWTYGIGFIMLRPKNDFGKSSLNPYKTLAAVDSKGRIGDNANLYYLSWISQVLIMVLVYHVCVDCFRWWRKGFHPIRRDGSKQNQHIITIHDQVQAMLSYTASKRLVNIYRKQRKTWYQFMLRLRERSGFWVAALWCSLVVMASSSFLYVAVLVAHATDAMDGNAVRYRDVCAILKGHEELPEELCYRTSFAVVTGGAASFLCVVAIILHLLVRRKAAADEEQQCGAIAEQMLPGVMDPERSRIHLRLEFLLSFLLSCLLGLNAIFATGVQGPAASVGNLYYASWLSFLLCLRICLGCLEEMYHIGSPVDLKRNADSSSTEKESDSQSSTRVGSEMSLNMDVYRKQAKKERSSRLRKYLFLAIFSTICTASALDAAYNQDGPCTLAQRYLVLAPCVVALLSIVLFLLCLQPSSYMLVSHICCGGLLSVISFGLWFIDLLLTMHSEDSWAVSGIGELKLANLYYFSWAAIITAGLQMFSYIKALFGGNEKDVMVMVWATIVKVCFVIFGSAGHVWYKIQDTCTEDSGTIGAVTFCSRTVFAIIVSVVGIIAGTVAVGTRVIHFCSIDPGLRTKVEAVVSFFLVLIFGTAVALITSIGGPGQTVGDLYYSTWLAFWVCIGVFVSCYDQMKQREMELEMERYNTEGADDYLNFEAKFGTNGHPSQQQII